MGPRDMENAFMSMTDEELKKVVYMIHYILGDNGRIMSLRTTLKMNPLATFPIPESKPGNEKGTVRVSNRIAICLGQGHELYQPNFHMSVTTPAQLYTKLKVLQEFYKKTNYFAKNNQVIEASRVFPPTLPHYPTSLVGVDVTCPSPSIQVPRTDVLDRQGLLNQKEITSPFLE